MADIFLSYDHDDRGRVTKLAAALESAGWQVWWDHRILPGQTWDEAIKDALDRARCVVVAWTRNSVQSEWVRIEANNGHERRILVPAMLEPVSLPLAFQLVQAAPLIDWDGTATHPGFQVLKAGIQAVLGARPAAAPLAVPADSTEPRALDAAIGRQLPLHVPAHLITMIRRADSNGLKAILEADDSWDLKAEDVASRPFDLTFPADASGRPAPATLTLHINAPDFDPPSQQKKVRVAAGRDSAVFDFLLAPQRAGDLPVQVEAYEGDVCLVSRVLKPAGVEDGAVPGRLVVSTPLQIKVATATFGGGARVGHWKPPASASSEDTATIRLEPAPAPVARQHTAVPKPPPSRTWMKFGVAAAMIVLCGPAIWYTARRPVGGKADLPSQGIPQPPPKEVPMKPAPVQARVMVEPRNAELIIDGEECARPCVLSLTPGRVEVKASARGLDPIVETVVIPPGKPVMILVNLRKGTVRVTHP